MRICWQNLILIQESLSLPSAIALNWCSTISCTRDYINQVIQSFQLHKTMRIILQLWCLLQILIYYMLRTLHWHCI